MLDENVPIGKPRRALVCSSITWMVFGANVVLFVLWARPLISASDSVAAIAEKDAAKLGMEVYFVKGPFALLVAKEFPRNDTFTLIEYGHPLVVSAEALTTEGGLKQRRVDLSLGTDFSMGCLYSFGKRIHVDELTLDKDRQCLIDFNADGRYDMRLRCDPKRSLETQLPEIWYKGRWREVVRGDKRGQYQRQLRDGGIVNFDMQSGLWLSPMEKPVGE